MGAGVRRAHWSQSRQSERKCGIGVAVHLRTGYPDTGAELEDRRAVPMRVLTGDFNLNGLTLQGGVGRNG